MTKLRKEHTTERYDDVILIGHLDRDAGRRWFHQADYIEMRFVSYWLGDICIRRDCEEIVCYHADGTRASSISSYAIEGIAKKGEDPWEGVEWE